MTRKTKIVYAKIAVILATIPVLVFAYEYGPDPGYTAAPGDDPTACVSSGCHVGTVNSGPGNFKIILPSGNTGTYSPGQAMQILVQITDATKAAYGFQLTARMGTGNETQSGDFTTTDANTQVLCADGSIKANGRTCPATFPVEYIEHTLTGYEASIKSTTKGSYSYSFNWTPPSAGSGTVTMYVAADTGTGDPPVVTPTNVYTSNITLTASTSLLLSQSITFGPLGNVAFGSGPLALAATASSNLAVSFASTTPGVCTVTGSTVTLVGVGACSITASQAGNATYAAAPNVTQGFAVTQAAQTIAFLPVSNIPLGSGNVFLTAVASSNLPVSFVSTTPTVCTVAGSTVTLVSIGVCSITASQAGNSIYAAAPSVIQSFSVIQTIHATTTTLVSSLNPSGFGQSITLTAIVSPTGATGTVTFEDGSTSVGTGALSNGAAAVTLTTLSAGSHSLTAVYGGDTNNAASTSSTLIQTVTTLNITSLSPTSATVAGAAFTLAVNGTGFLSGATVQWNGSALPTTFVNATQLTALVPASLIASAGTAVIVVMNPGGTSSNTLTLPINVPVPIITSLSPTSATVAGAAFALTVNGTGFLSGATVQWNGSALPTTFVNATQLTAPVSASLVASAGTAVIVVVNPGGTSSSAATFVITRPTINSSGVVPIYSSVPVIQPGSWVSIYGSGLANGIFGWNGDFPTSLGGVSVTINNKPAYLWLVSPTQINLQ